MIVDTKKYVFVCFLVFVVLRQIVGCVCFYFRAISRLPEGFNLHSFKYIQCCVNNLLVRAVGIARWFVSAVPRMLLFFNCY